MPIREAPQGALIAYTVLDDSDNPRVLHLVGSARTQAGAGAGSVPDRRRTVRVDGTMAGQRCAGGLSTRPDHPHFLAAFERVVPIFVPIGYAWFCGGLLYLLYRAFTKEFTARRIWALYGIIAVIDFIAIGLSAWIGILEFFGDPPMKIAGFVVWWAAIDALQVALGATLAVFLVPALRGAQRQVYPDLAGRTPVPRPASWDGRSSTALNSAGRQREICLRIRLYRSQPRAHILSCSRHRGSPTTCRPQSPVAPATRSYP